jgi:hypothetical protein
MKSPSTQGMSPLKKSGCSQAAHRTPRTRLPDSGEVIRSSLGSCISAPAQLLPWSGENTHHLKHEQPTKLDSIKNWRPSTISAPMARFHARRDTDEDHWTDQVNRVPPDADPPDRDAAKERSHPCPAVDNRRRPDGRYRWAWRQKTKRP